MQLVGKGRGALAGLLLALAGGVSFGSPEPQEKAPDAEGVEFFEKKIRPVLVERCYECHAETSKRLKGGLRLDSRAAVLKGGDTGPSIVPGDPDKSLLLKALRQKDDDLKMPPKGKLTDEQIADFEAWIKRGAPDPRSGGPAASGVDMDKGRRHWAYQAPREPAVPKVKSAAWVKSPIDAFVLAKLEEKGLAPRAPADRHTLLRRASFDLTGLPPTAEEMDAFLADGSADAFAKAVDRLLASPAYGERWGRHWLDVARYSDTKGYVFREERRYPFSYTYRDWVIRALNEDLPYDQFLIQQIAADRLNLGEDKRPLAAMGFLTLGRRFINNINDIIDDRLDVVCRGTMAMAIGCARCHDHKFDPIPTKDYYSLYGVFASSNEPKDLPAIDPPKKTPEMLDYEKQLAERKAEIQKFKDERFKELAPALRSAKTIAAGLLAAQEARDLGDMEKMRALAQKHDITAYTIERWKNTLKKKDPVFALWAAYAALPEKDFAAKAPEVKLDGQPAPLAEAFAKAPASLKEAAERYAAVLVKFDKAEPLENKDEEAIRKVLQGPDAPPTVAIADVEKLFNRAHRDKLNDITKKLEALNVTHLGAPAHAMVMVDNATPTEPSVFVRGNPNNRGEKIPRRLPEILTPPGKREPFKEGSGRLELAKAIASKDNPLTARVMVNRVWIHHFGAGIVRTPSDFGTRSDPPTHPELLDWLALRFIEDGWSIKKLHRRMLLSSVWQQGSDDDARSREIDPDNRLLWRQGRQRLDLESMRDSLLAAGGTLDATMGGRPVGWSSSQGVMKQEGETIRNTAADADPGQEVFSKRKTVYIFIDRQNLMGTYRDFDFASPDQHSPMRYSTTVPQQALFMMNSGFIVEQSKALAARPEIAGAKEGADRVRQLYRLLFQRGPSADEVALGLKYVQSETLRSGGPVADSPAWTYGYGQVDPATHRVTKFSPLPQFTGMAWQAGKNLPDPKLGWVLLTAEGGHPGNPQQGAAIRRWTAPRDGAVSIEGVLSHKASEGDGVLARLVSSAQGELASWTAHHTEAATKMSRVDVKKGDTIDFVVECRENESFDSFGWSPVIRMVESPATAVGGETMLEWSAAANFSGPPGKPRRALSPWEKYAQVLLETNEFMFVD